MRKIATALMSVLFFTQGALAKDMTGVIDVSGKVIIPIQYKSIRSVGNWLFICEGFNAPPGVVSPKLPNPPLSGLPTRELSLAKQHGEPIPPQSVPFLFDKNGKQVFVKVPAGLVVYDICIPNKYQQFEPVAKLPADTLITVAGKNGYGIIDGNGTVIIEPKYNSVTSLAEIQIHLRKVGETERNINGDKFDLDLAFQRSLQKETPEGKAAYAPHEGLVRFSEKGLFGFKDGSGKVKIPAKYYAAREFSCGYAPVRLNPFSEDGRYVYIDKNGKISSKEYFRADPFIGKTAIIAMYAMRSLTFGLIDTKFAYIQEPYCNGLTRMKDGLVVPTRGMIHAVFNKEGKPAFDLDFNRILINDGADGLVFRAHEGKGKDVIETYDTTGKITKSIIVDVPDPSKQEFYHTGFRDGPDGTILTCIHSNKGKTVIGPTDDSLQVTAGNLIIKTVHSKTFSKDDWDGPDRNREQAFETFIRQNKPLGMTRAELEKTLGKGKDEGNDVISYDLSTGGTGAPLGVVRFKDGRVEAIDSRHASIRNHHLEKPNPLARIIPIEVNSASGAKYPAYIEELPGKKNGKPEGILHIELGRHSR